MLCQLDQIIAQAAFIFVDQVFFSLNLVKLALLILIQKVHCTVNILTKLLCHTTHGTVALSNRKCRIIQKTFFQKVEVCLVLQFLCTVFH